MNEKIEIFFKYHIPVSKYFCYLEECETGKGNPFVVKAEEAVEIMNEVNWLMIY